jgi:protein-tyrosine phosphatase
MVGVLFVCMGNICRSPLAEGAFRDLAETAGLIEQGLFCDSAGTSSYHIGQAPDRRAIEVADRNGIDIRAQRARSVNPEDFERFHYVLAMDQYNLDCLLDRALPGRENKARLFLSYAPHLGIDEVPDPYYGGDQGFELCLDLVRAASQGLLEEIVREHFPDHRK